MDPLVSTERRQRAPVCAARINTIISDSQVSTRQQQIFRCPLRDQNKPLASLAAQ